MKSYTVYSWILVSAENSLCKLIVWAQFLAKIGELRTTMIFWTFLAIIGYMITYGSLVQRSKIREKQRQPLLQKFSKFSKLDWQNQAIVDTTKKAKKNWHHHIIVSNQTVQIYLLPDLLVLELQRSSCPNLLLNFPWSLAWKWSRNTPFLDKTYFHKWTKIQNKTKQDS